MSDFAIKVEGVSKKYCRTIKHTMLYGATDLGKSFLGLDQKSQILRNGEFWAVNDVSFELKRGQCLGLIGPNGSGKSTILKMLNGIFMPDTGRIELTGSVGALIEVGAGFHPLLTGRENIYVNGSILGLTKKEIDEKFDEIVDFSGIGDFLESPVKHYSSGMHVRLGFSIAVHCDPDILLVDEVLAVGDVNFKSKCYRKFLDFKNAGTSIIMVTHDMEPIVRYCDQAVLLQNGLANLKGKPTEITNYYMQIIKGAQIGEELPSKQTELPSTLTVNMSTHSQFKNTQNSLEKFLSEKHTEDRCITRKNYNSNEQRYGDKRAEIVDFLVVSNGVYEPLMVNCGDWVDIYIKIRFHEAVETPVSGIKIRSIDGIEIMGINTLNGIQSRPARKFEIIVYKFSVKLNLTGGEYYINLGVAESQFGHVELDRRFDLVCIRVAQTSWFDGFVNLEHSINECKLLTSEIP